MQETLTQVHNLGDDIRLHLTMTHLHRILYQGYGESLATITQISHIFTLRLEESSRNILFLSIFRKQLAILMLHILEIVL